MKIATNTTLLSLVALSSLGFLVSPVSAECKVGSYLVTYTDLFSCHYGCQKTGPYDCNREGTEFKCCKVDALYGKESNIEEVLKEMNEELDDQCRAGTHNTRTFTDYESCYYGCQQKGPGDCYPKPMGKILKEGTEFKCCEVNALYSKESNIEKVLKEMNEELDYIDAKLNNNK